MLYWYNIILLFIVLFLIYSQRRVHNYIKPREKIKTNTIIPTIVTYNIQKFPWSIKTFNNIVSLLDKYSIILLQECYDDTFSSLEENFPNYYIFRDTLLGASIMCNGLVILSKYLIVSYKSIYFKNCNRWTYDNLTNKGYIIVDININGNIISVINTHLQSSDYKRYDIIATLQLKEIFDYIDMKPNMQYILGGDFNIDITDINTIYDNTTIKYNYPRKPTIYIDFKTGKTKSSYDISYDGLIFDYFITNKNSNISIKEVNTIYCSYSDHNPVSGIIELTKASLEQSRPKNTLMDSSEGRSAP
jgi:endonuclease/exonuclease/phosphatase family metal-dependent hydrolase